MSKIYRMETWLPKAQAWQVEGYCSEPEGAAVMGMAFALGAHTKFSVTVIDLDDVQERDAICSYLTEFMRAQRQPERPANVN